MFSYWLYPKKQKLWFLDGPFNMTLPPRRNHCSTAWSHSRGQETIRDFIAFPKNNSGRDLMIDAPAPIDNAQLDELKLKLNLE